jgi:hypothetical protein
MPSGGWGFRPIMGTLKIITRAINEKQYSTEISVQSLFDLLASSRTVIRTKKNRFTLLRFGFDESYLLGNEVTLSDFYSSFFLPFSLQVHDVLAY